MLPSEDNCREMAAFAAQRNRAFMAKVAASGAPTKWLRETTSFLSKVHRDEAPDRQSNLLAAEWEYEACEHDEPGAVEATLWYKGTVPWRELTLVRATPRAPPPAM